MEIYQAEKDAGIAENILANTSIAYLAEVKTIKEDIERIKNIDISIQGIVTNKETSEEITHPALLLNKKVGELIDVDKIVKASIKDNELYYHTSILVTTSWNKNDDVFMPGIVWAAKDTPVHKPTNLGHDSTKIIGHMTGSWAIDTDGNQIKADEEITNLPSKFHILVGSVIYKVWHSNEEYEKNIEELIEQIEAGEKFVSMECVYKNFDYAIAADDGLKIIGRNQDTAFLSKYLRAYGGDGFYKNQKIGRAVKEISFCGKGYVDKPANPESIIFTKDEIFDFASAKIIEKINDFQKDGVISNTNEILYSTEKQIMSDFYKEQNDELKEKNTSLAKSLDELKEKLAQSNVDKLEKDIVKLTAQVADMSEALTKKSDEITAKETVNLELDKKSTDLAKANDELIKLNKELTEKLASIEVQNKANARISTLVAGGFSKEEADEKVKVFVALTDEQFDLVAKEIVEAKKYTKNPQNPSEAKAEDLDDAEVKDESVISAGAIDNGLDVSDLAKKLSAEFKTKDGDK